MIPDRDSYWIKPRIVKVIESSNLENENNQLKYETEESQESEIKSPNNAWERYIYLINSMDKRGEKYNKKLLLEAMFLGNNLIYTNQHNNNSNNNCV